MKGGKLERSLHHGKARYIGLPPDVVFPSTTHGKVAKGLSAREETSSLTSSLLRGAALGLT